MTVKNLTWIFGKASLFMVKAMLLGTLIIYIFEKEPYEIADFSFFEICLIGLSVVIVATIAVVLVP